MAEAQSGSRRRKRLQPLRARLSYLRLLARTRGDRRRAKHLAELRFWREYMRDHGSLPRQHYERFFTTDMHVDRAAYDGARVLDIGCGPAGSLEWATEALERVGVDPLVSSYREFGIDTHAMTYVETDAESLPFPDGHFDIVTSFNSFDHVDDIDAVAREIGRVTRPGGTFLLLTDVHDHPRPTEPAVFGWDVGRLFSGQFDTVEERHFEEHEGPYKSMDADQPFDHSDPTPRSGVLAIRLQRRPA